MHALTTHFEKLFESLKPAQERLDAARDLPAAMRDYLRVSEFDTVNPHTRLVGSYAQDLSVSDIKDVDILVRVDGDPTANEPDAKRLIRNLRTAVQEFPNWDYLPSWICHGGTTDAFEVERARRSVHVYFAEHDFHLDLVPCIAPNGLNESIWVPDYGWNRWIPSHPLGVVSLISELDQVHIGKVRRLGKLLKHFRNYQMATRRPKSYWLIALLIHQVRSGNLNLSQPIAVVFHELLDGIYKKYASLLPRTDEATPNVLDPMLGHNVSWNWSRSHFETFMRRLDDGRRWSSRALETSDRDTAIELWQRIFGECWFPSEIDGHARTIAAAMQPGASAVLSSGLILSASSPTRATSLVRPTTFHGSKNE